MKTQQFQRGENILLQNNRKCYSSYLDHYLNDHTKLFKYFVLEKAVADNSLKERVMSDKTFNYTSISDKCKIIEFVGRFLLHVSGTSLLGLISLRSRLQDTI